MSDTEIAPRPVEPSGQRVNVGRRGGMFLLLACSIAASALVVVLFHGHRDAAGMTGSFFAFALMFVVAGWAFSRLFGGARYGTVFGSVLGIAAVMLASYEGGSFRTGPFWIGTPTYDSIPQPTSEFPLDARSAAIGILGATKAFYGKCPIAPGDPKEEASHVRFCGFTPLSASSFRSEVDRALVSVKTASGPQPIRPMGEWSDIRTDGNIWSRSWFVLVRGPSVPDRVVTIMIFYYSHGMKRGEQNVMIDVFDS